MSTPKRPGEDMTSRQKKKQKTAMARTIAVQPRGSSGSSTPAPNAVAGPSKGVVHFEGLPSSIDVEKFTEARAFEISAMHTAMKSARANASHRAWQQLPRHLRRRAASHDVRRVPLRLRDKAKAEMDPMRRKALGRSMPKRGKGKKQERTQVLVARQKDKVWLETHIWHAKRMKMENMWGYRLAVQPTEKSFRPSHRASMHGAILHDASYYGFIELKGPETVLRTVLEACCDPQGPSPGAKRFTTGSRTCETHFYERLAYPFSLIAPVSVMWRPNKDEKKAEQDSKPAQKSHKGKETPQAIVQPSRCVWLKVHPSMFEDVWKELRTATSYVLEAVKQTASPDDPIAQVEIADLRERLNVFEITGPKASQILKGALRPVADDTRSEFRKTWNAMSNLQTSASVPRNTVIGFKVYDPRLSFPPKNAKVNHAGAGGSTEAAVAFYPTSTLAQSEIWDSNVRDSLRRPHFKKKDIDERKSKNLVPGTALQAQEKDDRIPVLLIQRSFEGSQTNPSIHGWTLVIPSGWAMPFLSSLVFTGTRVGGQRERQTQSFEAGCSYFPRDYPTTVAYDDMAEDRACDEQESWERKPPAKRPNYGKLGSRSPWKPDWDVVLGIRDAALEEQAQEEMLTSQREEAMDVDAVLGTVQADMMKPWLLRGLDAQTAFHSLNTPANLSDFVNMLRQKRGMAPSKTQAQDLWNGALVRVKVRMVSRGCPEDMAIIYSMDDAEARKWIEVERLGRNGAALDADCRNEEELSALVPSQGAIIGYVTSGNFSLSLGEGCAIGAIPLAKLVELNKQAIRLRSGKPLVKVRERHEVICRAAHLEVLLD